MNKQTLLLIVSFIALFVSVILFFKNKNTVIQTKHFDFKESKCDSEMISKPVIKQGEGIKMHNKNKGIGIITNTLYNKKLHTL